MIDAITKNWSSIRSRLINLGQSRAHLLESVVLRPSEFDRTIGNSHYAELVIDEAGIDRSVSYILCDDINLVPSHHVFDLATLERD